MTQLHFADALLPDGWHQGVRIRLDGRTIARVQAGRAPSPRDERHAIAIPGMPNLHSHAFQRAMAGLAETRGASTDTFWTWRELMYRFALAMTPDDMEAVAGQLYAEMLESGFTRVGEFHYLHHDVDGRRYGDIAEMAARIAAAATTAGIGLTLLPSFYAHGGLGGTPAQESQRRFVTSLDGFARLWAAAQSLVAGLPGATLGLAPHSLRAVTPSELAHLLRMAGPVPVHIHVAEQLKEVEDCLAWSGRRPVDWLLEHARVDRHWCLVHVTHMTAQETARLARSGAVAGLCPTTEANLGDGVFNGTQYLGAGGRLGIGTDTNVAACVAGELRQLEYAQRLRERQRNVLVLASAASTGRSLFDMALTGGARALGLAASGIREGAPADIVSLDARHPSFPLVARDRALDSWIFSAGQRLVDCVWAQGVKRVAGGRHMDSAAIARRYAKAMERLRQI